MTVGNVIRQIFKVMKRRFNESGSIITFEQFGLLHAISIKKEEVVQQDMAEMLGKDKSAILRLIDSLESKGLVVRNSDPLDKRKNVLSVTPQGTEVIQHFAAIAVTINEEFVKDISQADLDTFYAVVQKIQNNAEKIL